MLVFVEAGVASTGLSCLKWARDAGMQVGLVTTDPQLYRYVPAAEMLPELTRRGRVFITADTAGDQLPPGLVEWAISDGTPLGIVCTDDRQLLFAAQLADALQAPFPSPQAVATFRNKRASRQLCNRLDIRTPRWTPVASVGDAVGLWTQTGSPLLLRNVSSMGSRSTVLCQTPEDIHRHDAFLADSGGYPEGDWMAEEYLTGPVVSMEAVISAGTIIHLGVCDRHVGPPPYFCEYSATFPVTVAAADYGEMAQAMSSCAQYFGISHGFFHAQFVLTPTGPVLVDVSTRLGGGLLATMMDDCLTTPTWELLCRVALGMPVSQPKHNGRYTSAVTVYPESSGIVKEIICPEAVAKHPGVVDVLWHAASGDRVAPPAQGQGALCQIRTVANAPSVAYNAAVAASHEVHVTLLPEDYAENYVEWSIFAQPNRPAM